MDETTPVIDAAVAPRIARMLAFGAILLGGLFGGLIGWALVQLQCHGDCGLAKGLGVATGAVVASIGVAVVATLVMRAMGEWRTIQHGVNPRNGERLDRLP